MALEKYLQEAERKLLDSRSHDKTKLEYSRATLPKLASTVRHLRGMLRDKGVESTEIDRILIRLLRPDL